jgi:hypothetical protein
VRFKRSLLGYRRRDVHEAIEARDGMLDLLGETLAAAERRVARDRAAIEARDLGLVRQSERIDELEQVANHLAGRVVEREGELKRIRAELARARPAQREALEAELLAPPVLGAKRPPPRESRPPAEPGQVAAEARPEPMPLGSNGHRAGGMGELFEGTIEVEIGPLSDFSQLVGFEDAAGAIAATSEISVKRFTKGRATLAMRFKEPVALLRELEERAPFEFRIRDLRSNRLVLDVDE